MKKRENGRRILLAALCACLLLASCGNGGVSRKNTSEELEAKCKKAESFVDYAYEKKMGNTLVSPLSLDLVLAMLTEGASGETAEELNRYLGREDFTAWAKDYLKHARNLKSGPFSKSGYQFSYKLGNSVWVNKDFKLTDEYQKLMEKNYYALVQKADFGGAPQKTANQINEWCDKNTDGMIKEIVKPDLISEDLAVVLLNTVYFESPWKKAWREESGTFTDFSGEKTEQLMLSSKETIYYENEKAKAFGKPYEKGFLFIGILPNEEGEFSLKDLDLKSLLDSKTNKKVLTKAPKLDFETDVDLIGMLKEQGVERVFSLKEAELGRMIEDEELYVSEVMQKCKIQLDQNGTRAAAATTVMAKMKFDPVKAVYLTRPFAFLIYDEKKGEIVFAGKIVTVK